MTYPDTRLFIDGQWHEAADGRTMPVLNPATGQQIGRVAHAGRRDLDLALQAAQRGFDTWREKTPAERSRIMRTAAGLMRERAQGGRCAGGRLLDDRQGAGGDASEPRGTDPRVRGCGLKGGDEGSTKAGPPQAPSDV
jgi:succinate-semialdehyde dehydrogenase/glutarate-semialdehyde dehydrogenase